jgi:hypothetical protein
MVAIGTESRLDSPALAGTFRARVSAFDAAGLQECNLPWKWFRVAKISEEKA